MFGCLPDEAGRQDLATVLAIAEYRAARAAVAAFNDTKQGYDTLSKNPGLADILLRMTRSQPGGAATPDQLYTLMGRRAAEGEG